MLKYDAIGLISKGAVALKRRDGGAAFALSELANNLRLVMRGEATIDEWNKVYVGADCEPIDIDKELA